MSRVDSPGLLLLTLGAMISLGLSSASFGIVIGAVSRLVSDQHRSMYVGVVMMGGSAGFVILVPTGQVLMNALGWRDSLMGLAMIALAMPILALLLTGRAEDRDGARANPLRAIQGATREPRYWLLFWGFFVCGFHITFIATHLPAYLQDRGLAPELGALALSLIGVSNIAGSFLAGWAGGRFSKRVGLSTIYFARAGVLLTFILLPLSPFSVALFASTIGLLWLSTVPLTTGLLGQMYGVRYLNTLFGVVFLGHQIGGFLGVWAGGKLFDLLGSYDLVWWISVGLGVFAGLIHLPIDERTLSDVDLPASVARESA